MVSKVDNFILSGVKSKLFVISVAEFSVFFRGVHHTKNWNASSTILSVLYLPNMNMTMYISWAPNICRTTKTKPGLAGTGHSKKN